MAIRNLYIILSNFLRMRKRESLAIVLVIVSIFLLLICLVMNFYSEDAKRDAEALTLEEEPFLKFNEARGEIIIYEKR